MKKILKISAIASAILTPTFAQAQATSPMEVSAKVVGGCFVTAGNINFGTLITPITDQSAQESIRVKCSNNAPYNIGIIYGDSGSSSSVNVTVQQRETYSDGVTFKLLVDGKEWLPYSKAYPDGQAFGCGYGSEEGKILYRTTNFKDFSNYEGINVWKEDILNICGEKGVVNINNLAMNMGISNGGVIKGLVANEEINYYLEVPNETELWSSSKIYNGIGNGVEQVIPMKANIKRADNPTHRMTPDTYQGTLQVVLTY